MYCNDCKTLLANRSAIEKTKALYVTTNNNYVSVPSKEYDGTVKRTILIYICAMYVYLFLF